MGDTLRRATEASNGEEHSLDGRNEGRRLGKTLPVSGATDSVATVPEREHQRGEIKGTSRTTGVI